MRMQIRDFSAAASQLQAVSQQGVLQGVLQALSQNDYDALPQYFADDAELHIHGFSHLNGSWRGRAKVIAAMSANFQKVAQQKPAIRQLIEQGNTLVARLHETGLLVASQTPYEVEAVIWCTFEAGKLAKLEEFVHPMGRLGEDGSLASYN